MPQSERVLQGSIVFSHYGCLGHTSRVFTIAGKGGLRIVSLSPAQEYLDYTALDLPILFSRYPVFGERTFFDPSCYKELVDPNRLRWLFDCVKDDVFVVFEYFPFGRFQIFKEMMALAKALKKRGVKVFSSVGYPILNYRHLERVRKGMEVVDHVFFHCSKEELRFWMRGNLLLGDLLRDFMGKYSITGYIDALPLPFKYEANVEIPFEDYVLVLRGSGIVMDRLVTAAIDVAKLLPQERFVIVLGPASRIEVRTMRVPDNVVVVPYVQDIDGLLEKAKMAICTSSYNTAVKIVKHRVPAIFVPFEGTDAYPGLNEQRVRAEFLTHTAPNVFVSLKEEELLPGIVRFAERIRNLELKAFPEFELSGAERTLSLILEKL